MLVISCNFKPGSIPRAFFMKIALAQLNFHIGNFDHNYAKMHEQILLAIEQGADLIVFPELSVCGYPPRDFLEFDDFIERCEHVIGKLTQLSTNIAIIAGTPVRNPQKEGKDLFNAAVFMYEGEVKAAAHKALLPTYDIFDEYRYFEPGTSFSAIEFKGKRMALTVCEDIWNVGNDNPMYKSCPMDVLTAGKPDFMINISASPFDFGQARRRIDVVRANTQRYGIPMFYVNHVGAQTDLIFDGGSLVVNAYGVVVDEMPYFEEKMCLYDVAEVQHSNWTTNKEQPKEKIALIHDALLCGIRDYFAKLGFKKAILGLSGGIDSAVTAVLAARALGAENIRCLLLPSAFSSTHSVDDSVILCERGHIDYNIIPIGDMVDEVNQQLSPYFEGKPFDVTEENIQARIRGLTLMAMCNKHGYILLNTTNKSEAAVGYGTLYGDLCGGLAVLADVYKTEIYELANYINKDFEYIPHHILTKAPSAELRPNQKDQDTLPPYDLLDQILYRYIECRQSPADIIAAGFDAYTVNRTLRMVNKNEWKRYQMAPVLRVSAKSFGMGRRMPIEGEYLS
jgi:NAD+ synthase (glutamine-hydrolysing)